MIERLVGFAIAGLLQALIAGTVTWIIWKLTRKHPMTWHMFIMPISKLPGYIRRRYVTRNRKTYENVSTGRRD